MVGCGRTLWRPATAWGVCVVVLLVSGCSTAPKAVSVPFARDRIDTPVIFVPGTTGSRLRDRVTGKLVWGKGGNLVCPLDGGYAMAVPIDPPSGEQPQIEADEVIKEIRLLGGLIRKEVYGPLIRALTTHGYRSGDLADPRVDDTFFAFAYDWRQEATQSSHQLLAGLERLRTVRGEETLPVVLICQSTGVNLCRYLLKYGGCTPADAELGRPCSPTTIAVKKLILIAPSTGGSMRTFRMADRGRRYLRPFFRKWQPEALFAFVSLYQDLPAYGQDLFVDESGKPLDIDLYDVRSWQTFGWSVFGRKARARLARNRRTDLFGTDEERLVFVQKALTDARRFHRLLVSDVPNFGGTAYFLILSSDQETCLRAVVVRKNRQWHTYYPGDKQVPAQLLPRTTAAGDGHATRRSQMWLSPQELEAIVGEPFVPSGRHFDIILSPAVHRRLLEILQD